MTTPHPPRPTRPGRRAGDPSAIDRAADDVASDLDAARAEAAEYLDHLRRLQAEFDNYRKRVLKEQTDAVERAPRCRRSSGCSRSWTTSSSR